MSRTTGNGPSGNQPDDGDCVVCGDPADGVDAPTRQPICRRCASIRCDGGQEIRPGRRRVTSSITFGGASSNYVSTPDEDVNHLSGEVSIEVSGASSDYPHPTRLQREIEAAVADVLENYGDKVADDVDRGDGVETDGGEPTKFDEWTLLEVEWDCITRRAKSRFLDQWEKREDWKNFEARYHLYKAHDQLSVASYHSRQDDAGALVKTNIADAVNHMLMAMATLDVDTDECQPVTEQDVVDRGDEIVTDGGRDLYSCDTPTCDGEKEVITPDGYVCRDCADALAVQYEEVDRGDGVVTDGGLLTGGSRYHVVCSDCTFEDLKRERHQAARAVDDHRTDEPSHSVRFEEVRGR